MKRLFIFFVLGFVLLAQCLYAAKICKKNVAPWNGVDNIQVDENFGPAWQASYKGFIVNGVSVCYHTSSGGGPEVPSWGWGLNCWCRMTEPVVGSWVFRNSFPNQLECQINCALGCATCVRDGTNISCTRTALLAA
jgi:hypothetical protein